MGLQKVEQLANGVEVDYHRVASIAHTVNASTAIRVHSYTSKRKRDELKLDELADVYVAHRTFALPYDDSLTVVGAYEWLKEQPEFEGAEDVFELEEAEQGTGQEIEEGTE